MPLTIIETGGFNKGQIDIFDARNIPRGAASASLNWLTKGDHIEIRPGQAYLGTSSVQNGNGKVTGLKKGTTSQGVEILFGTYGKKLKYYDEVTHEWIENGSDLLGSAIVDSNGFGIENIFMSEYTGLAGNQMYLNSPNCSGYYKLMVANPASALNVYDSSKNFKGYIKVDTNRTLLWGRAADKTGLYGSYIDSQTYTTVASESVGTGDGTTTHFIHTLAAISGTKTSFALSVTAGSVILSDNFNRGLTASDGSTGTINYITGALVVDFATAPANLQAITVAYQWEDTNSGGVTDFTKGSPRLAGQGFVFRQDEGGGALQSVNTYNEIYYCLHLKKTWVLNLGQTDTTATNLPYRQLVGAPNPRASVEAGEGIYYIDTSNENDVKFRLLTYETGGSQQVLPVPISNNLNLNNYNFDQGATAKWGDLLLFACATKDSTQVINGMTVSVNNRVLVYNLLWRSFDPLDYASTCFEVYNGSLVAGDSLSNNFMTLFSGYDDFDSDSIANYWIGNMENLQYVNPKSRRVTSPALHSVKKFYLQGFISKNQKIKVSLSIDGGDFFEIGGTDIANGSHTYAIEGTGSYIDETNSINIGAQYLGNHPIGGNINGGTQAFHYERLFTVNTAKFEYVKIKYEAIAVGYASVLNQKYWDVRNKGKKVPQKSRG